MKKIEMAIVAGVIMIVLSSCRQRKNFLILFEKGID